jgi:acyl carrier protein
MMEKREEIKEIVIKLIREFLPKANKEITGDMKIMGDLLSDGDEATEFILDAEKILNIKTPVKDWLQVLTVDDMVDLLLKYSS